MRCEGTETIGVSASAERQALILGLSSRLAGCRRVSTLVRGCITDRDAEQHERRQSDDDRHPRAAHDQRADLAADTLRRAPDLIDQHRQCGGDPRPASVRGTRRLDALCNRQFGIRWPRGRHWRHGHITRDGRTRKRRRALAIGSRWPCSETCEERLPTRLGGRRLLRFRLTRDLGLLRLCRTCGLVLLRLRPRAGVGVCRLHRRLFRETRLCSASAERGMSRWFFNRWELRMPIVLR